MADMCWNVFTNQIIELYYLIIILVIFYFILILISRISAMTKRPSTILVSYTPIYASESSEGPKDHNDPSLCLLRIGVRLE